MSETLADPKNYSKLYLYCLVINASIGSFQMGYEMAIMNQFQLYLSNDIFRWTQAQSNLYIGLLGAMIPLGAIFGSFSAGFLAQGLGRRTSLIVTDILAIIGMTLSIFVNYQLMLVGWCISGVCAGLNIMLATLYCNEVSPVAMRGISGCLYSAMLSLGIFSAFLTGYGLPYPYGGETNSFWKFMIMFPSILVTLQMLLLLTVFNKDTPKYLVQHHKDEEAKEVLTKIYSGSEQLANEHYKMLVDERELDLHAASVKFTEIFSKKYRYRTTVGVLLVVFYQLTGAFVILTYSTSIFLGNNYAIATIPSRAMYEKALTLTVVLGLVQVLSTIPSIYLVQNVGRKNLVFWGFVLMALTYVIFEVFLTGILAQISIVAFMVESTISVGVVVWIYLPEILPDVAEAFAWQIFWIVYALYIFIFPIFVAATSIRIAFSVFLFGNVLGAIFTAIWLLETKDKTNDQIIEMYCPEEFWDHKVEKGEEHQSLMVTNDT